MNPIQVGQDHGIIITFVPPMFICVSNSYKRFSLRNFLHKSSYKCLGPSSASTTRGVSARISIPLIRVSRGSQHFVFNPVVVRTMFRIGHVFAQMFNQHDHRVPATLRCERPSTRTTRNRGDSIYVEGSVNGHLVAESFTAITQEIVLLCTVTAALCSGTLVSRRKVLALFKPETGAAHHRGPRRERCR